MLEKSFVVTVTPAPATDVITSPSGGATVSGTVLVDVTGSVDPAGHDAVGSFQLQVDENALRSPVLCPTTGRQQTCSVVIPWDSRQVADGPHTLLIQSFTQGNYGTATEVTVAVQNTAPASAPTPPVVSPPATVLPITIAPVSPPAMTAPRPTLITVSAPARLLHGASGLVTGVVTDTSGTAVEGAAVRVGFTPAGGVEAVVTAITDMQGRYAAASPGKVVRTTAVTASTSDAALTASATIDVGVAITCRAASAGRLAEALHCDARGLPTGSRVVLHYAGNAGKGAVTSLVKGGTAGFTVRTAKRGWLSAWVTSSASASLVASHSRVYALHLR